MRLGREGDLHRVAWPTIPLATTTAITPALRTSPPSSSRSRTAFISPGRKPSSCVHGLRRPVTSTTARRPITSLVPAGSEGDAHAGRTVRSA